MGDKANKTDTELGYFRNGLYQEHHNVTKTGFLGEIPMDKKSDFVGICMLAVPHCLVEGGWWIFLISGDWSIIFSEVAKQCLFRVCSRGKWL